MKPPEQDLAERQAQASPRDFPEDFDRETTWNVCADCIHLFLGMPSRTHCRDCAGRKTLEG